MKRIITLALCAIMALSLFGCGKSKDSVITIAMSEEAQEYEKGLIEECAHDLFTEDAFDITMQYVANRGEQVLPDCDLENEKDSFSFEGQNVYTLETESYDSIVLYIHGGAWVFEIDKAHVTFCDDLATRLNAKVYIPLYPLAPEATGEETYAFIEDLYKEILKEGKTVYIMGDSAGGELTLGLMYLIKQDKLTYPEKLVVMAPCSDMTFTNKEMAEIDKTDHELAIYGCYECAKLWAGEENLTNPKYSAVYADPAGYPDTMIIQGTNDILCADNMILYQNFKDAGVNVTLVKGEGFWHVFSVYSIPERETSLDLIKEFCIGK